MPRVGPTVGTVTTCESSVMRLSAPVRLNTAVAIGSIIETADPKVTSRITIAAVMPMSSLLSVWGLETFCPSWPPAATVRSASSIGCSMLSTSCSISSLVYLPIDSLRPIEM